MPLEFPIIKIIILWPGQIISQNLCILKFIFFLNLIMYSSILCKVHSKKTYFHISRKIFDFICQYENEQKLIHNTWAGIVIKDILSLKLKLRIRWVSTKCCQQFVKRIILLFKSNNSIVLVPMKTKVVYKFLFCKYWQVLHLVHIFHWWIPNIYYTVLFANLNIILVGLFMEKRIIFKAMRRTSVGVHGYKFYVEIEFYIWPNRFPAIVLPG